MNPTITHIYCIPGMAASTAIFERINLPKPQYQIHYLPWLPPLKNETISDYSLRMSKKITHESPVLLGVSFGGIIAQEINKHVAVCKTIVISSVLHESDFPLYMKIAKKTRLYKLLPLQLLARPSVLMRLLFLKKSNQKEKLFKKYMSVTDSKYLSWAIHCMLHWQQTQQLKNVLHIHGKKDIVFPVKNCSNKPVLVENGTHIMIVSRYKKINELLLKYLGS